MAVGPATQLLAANGQTANYTMSVTNNDSQGCENSTFNLALESVVAFSGSNVTSGFSHNLSATSMNLAPGQSTGINLSLTPQAVADSNFTLTVKANDLSVGVHNGSGQAELMLDSQAPASPSDLTATHRKVKGQKSVLLEWTAAVGILQEGGFDVTASEEGPLLDVVDASPGSGVVSYRIYRNGVLVGQVAELKFADSNYSSTGANDYTVYSTDQAGHVSEAPAAVSYTDGGGSGGPRGGNGKKRK